MFNSIDKKISEAYEKMNKRNAYSNLNESKTTISHPNNCCCKECDNGGLFQPLNETTLNRILSKRHFKNGFCIISASRSERTVAENNQKTNELKNLLGTLGYGYIPVYGGFKETQEDGSVHQVYEKSFMVYPYSRTGKEVDFDELEAVMLDLGKRFGQESILVKRENSAPTYVDCNTGEIQMQFSPDVNDIKINDMTKEFFTALKKMPNSATDKEGNISSDFEGKPQRFTFESCYLDKEPSTLMGAHSRYAQGELYGGRYP